MIKRLNGRLRRFVRSITPQVRCISNRILPRTLYFAGRYEEALENIKGSETVAPDIAAAIYVRVGRVEEARAIIADWLKIGPILDRHRHPAGQ